MKNLWEKFKCNDLMEQKLVFKACDLGHKSLGKSVKGDFISKNSSKFLQKVILNKWKCWRKTRMDRFTNVIKSSLNKK